MSRRLAFSMTLVLTIAACHDRREPAGTYRLQEVNGSPLPAVGSQRARGHAEIIDGAYTLDTNGSYRARILVRVTSDTGVYLDSAAHTGRYVSRRDSLIFLAATGDQVNGEGELLGPLLTFRYPGWTFVYRR